METKTYYYTCSPEYIHQNTLTPIGLDVPIWLVGIGGE
jgi:hypothetical protein